MAKPVILVTGANGQLGKELQVLAEFYDNYSFLFATKEDLPIQDEAQVQLYFTKHRPTFCINCAAYTNVDGAETEPDKAFSANVTGPRNLALAALEFGCGFVTISTDYVFDGAKDEPYREDDPVGPLGVYGASKLAGELAVRAGD